MRHQERQFFAPHWLRIDDLAPVRPRSTFGIAQKCSIRFTPAGVAQVLKRQGVKTHILRQGNVKRTKVKHAHIRPASMAAKAIGWSFFTSRPAGSAGRPGMDTIQAQRSVFNRK